MIIKPFNDKKSIEEYRYLRWVTFRKPHNLPLGSEYYEGEEKSIYIGAFEKNKLVGGVFGIDRGNSNIQMHQLVIDPEFQRKGIGKSLVLELESQAIKRGFKYIYAHARTHIKPFYITCGYEVVANDNYPKGFSTVCAPGVPHIFMRKKLQVQDNLINKKSNNKSITVSAPGKLMLMGDHAVVYGRPCLVTALDKRIKVTIEKLDQPIFQLEANEVDIVNYVKPINELGKNQTSDKAKFIEMSLLNFIKRYPAKNGYKITTQSDFSSQFGLGSSSAVVAATIKALAIISNINLSQKEIFDLSFKTIFDVQSLGSGFDVAASIYGGTLYFIKAGKVIEPLQTNGMDLVIGYSGFKADTVSMVKLVREKWRNYKKATESIFDNIANLVNEAKTALINKDFIRLGTLMNYNQDYLEDLGVSTEKLNQMVEAVRKNGAYGAKISGAGGGDCMIALVSADKKMQISEAIINTGGQIIEANVNAVGLKLEKN